MAEIFEMAPQIIKAAAPIAAETVQPTISAATVATELATISPIKNDAPENKPILTPLPNASPLPDISSEPKIDLMPGHKLDEPILGSLLPDSQDGPIIQKPQVTQTHVEQPKPQQSTDIDRITQKLEQKINTQQQKTEEASNQAAQKVESSVENLTNSVEARLANLETTTRYNTKLLEKIADHLGVEKPLNPVIPAAMGALIAAETFKAVTIDQNTKSQQQAEQNARELKQAA